MSEKKLLLLLGMALSDKEVFTVEELRDILKIIYTEGVYPYLRSLKEFIVKSNKGEYSLSKNDPRVLSLKTVTKVYHDNSKYLINRETEKILNRFRGEPIISEKQFNKHEKETIKKIINKTRIMHEIELSKNEKGYFIEVHSLPIKALLDFFEIDTKYDSDELRLAIQKYYSNLPNTSIPPSKEEQDELRKKNVEFYLREGDNVLGKLKEKLDFEYLEDIEEITKEKKISLEKNLFDFTTKLDNWKLNYIFNTDKIEGNALSMQDVKTILTIGDYEILDKKKEVLETINSKTALDRIFNTNYEIDEDFIKKLNLATQNGISTAAGFYKFLENCLVDNSGIIIDYTTPSQFVSERMAKMVEWYNKNKSILHPFVLATAVHTQFVAIHPFDDGNGRVARLLFNFILIKHGYFPIIFYNSDKHEYYSNIRKSKYGDISHFLKYVIQLYKNQTEEFF